jgi:site-specific recombinase XerD
VTQSESSITPATPNKHTFTGKKYILFHNKRHPKEMEASEVQTFLAHLAQEEHIPASTQNQALSALFFLYRNVLGQELGPVDSVRARTSQHVPTVLSVGQVGNLLPAQLWQVVLYSAWQTEQI